MRLTKDIVQKLLDLNEGFKKTTSYSGKNYKDTTHYLIEEGKLLIRSVGKTSWADSRFDNVTVASVEQARSFLKKYLAELKTDGIE